MLRQFLRYLILSSLLITACSQNNNPADNEKNPPEPPALKMANFAHQAWLRKSLPENTVGYFRQPTLWHFFDNVDNGFKYAQGNEAHVNLIKQVQSGFYENLLAQLESTEKPLAELLVKHNSGPFEIAVVLNEKNPMAPTSLMATRINIESQAEFSKLLKELFSSEPMIEQVQEMNASGIGTLSISPMAINAAYHFDETNGKFIMAISNQLDLSQLESIVTSLPQTKDHPMYAAEKQIDESGKGFFAFVDVKAILPKLEGVLPPEAKAGLQMSGVDKLNAVALGYGASQGKTRFKILIDMPSVGFRAYLPSVANDYNFSARGDISTLGVFSLPSEVQYKRIEATVSMMKGRSQEYDHFKQTFKNETGFEVEQILSIVGPEVVYLSDSVSDFIAVRLQNKESFKKLLQKGQEKDAIRYTSRNVNGITIHHAESRFFSFDDEAFKTLDTPPLMASLMKNIKNHYFWIEEDNFLILSGIPQPLIERASRKDKVNVNQWLENSQGHSLKSAFLGITTSKEGMSRKSYYLYLQLLNALSDISGSNADIFSLPHAGELNFSDKGSMGFSVDLAEKFVAIELNFEQSMLDVFFAGGYESIAMVGILSAVALPAYNDYTVRSQTSMVIHEASALKNLVSELAVSGVTLDEINNGSNQIGSATDYASDYIDYIEVTRGEISVGIGGPKAKEAIRGSVIKLAPETTASGIEWSCSGIDIEPKYLPAECR
ncbi:pilin [Aliikangiella sp. G2MR2-5]|uniref:pilin n=1 Tax=Aliikangiella sp. G2MR2-5 TaxID=2788943 RepID=UPI0018A8FB45|nr:pilin [Aliikangiella sp. G2MR2-5]